MKFLRKRRPMKILGPPDPPAFIRIIQGDGYDASPPFSVTCDSVDEALRVLQRKLEQTDFEFQYELDWIQVKVFRKREVYA